ncbi:hypothetical protein [Paenibacillus sp. J23TS9]|nr:hypothetical protein [Paenibacillus sp. J23TS9]
MLKRNSKLDVPLSCFAFIAGMLCFLFVFVIPLQIPPERFP